MSEHIVSVKLYLGIFVALLCLTALTTGVAYIDLGAFNTVAALAIAVVKMMLVILFFMHVKYSGRLTQVFILAGFLFLAILITFTLADELTRHWSPTPTGWGMIAPLLSRFFSCCNLLSAFPLLSLAQSSHQPASAKVMNIATAAVSVSETKKSTSAACASLIWRELFSARIAR